MKSQKKILPLIFFGSKIVPFIMRFKASGFFGMDIKDIIRFSHISEFKTESSFYYSELLNKSRFYQFIDDSLKLNASPKRSKCLFNR